MLNMAPFAQFDEYRQWHAMHYHFVPALVLSDGSCSNLHGPFVGDTHQWWPMLINGWVPAISPISGQCDHDLFWGMCPALAINGGRPWPVRRCRIFVLTNDILEPEESTTTASASPRKKARAESEAGESTAPPESEAGESMSLIAPSIAGSWESTITPSTADSWALLEPATPER